MNTREFKNSHIRVRDKISTNFPDGTLDELHSNQPKPLQHCHLSVNSNVILTLKIYNYYLLITVDKV